MATVDPLHIPAECRRDDTDYQWFSLLGIRDPEATGWVPVARSEMPTFPSDCSTTIDRREMRLYKRPMALTKRVREQETAVARQSVAELRPLTARPVTSPLGPEIGWRTLRGLMIYAAVWLRRSRGAPDSQWLVEKFARTNALGLSRWAEENRVSLGYYVKLHTDAILAGKGRWPGLIVRAAPR